MVRARRACWPIIFACGLASCGGAAEPAPSSVSDASAGDPANGHNDASVPGSFGFGDAAQPLPTRDAGTPAPPLDAGDPPARACEDDAGDAGACALPSSVCADGRWLVYYVGGDCVGGACRWEQRFLLCSRLCTNGACAGIITAPVPR